MGWLSMQDLPALIPRQAYKMLAESGINAGNNIGEGLIERGRRRDARQELADRLAQQKAIADQEAAHQTAVLGETGRHNQAVEGNAAAQLEAETVQRQAAEVRNIEEAVRKSGGNPEVIRAAKARLALLGLNAQEMPGEAPPQTGIEMPVPPETAAANGGATAVTPSLQSFPGAPLGHGGVSDTPSGRFSLRRSKDDVEMGTIDAPAIRESQLHKDSPALQAFGGLGGPVQNPSYRGAAEAVGNTPFETEAEALAAGQNIAGPAARDATSMVNAAARTDGMSEYQGAGLSIRRDQAAHNMYKDARNSVIKNSGVPALRQRKADGLRVVQLLEQAQANDETGLMAATALSGVIRAGAGARYSDADKALIENAFGGFDQIENRINKWAKGGQRTPLQMKALKKLGQYVALGAAEELKAAGQLGYDQIVSHPSLPKYWDQATIKHYADQVRRDIEGAGEATPTEGGPADEGDGGGGGATGRTTSRRGMLAVDGDVLSPEELE